MHICLYDVSCVSIHFKHGNIWGSKYTNCKYKKLIINKNTGLLEKVWIIPWILFLKSSRFVGILSNTAIIIKEAISNIIGFKAK